MARRLSGVLRAIALLALAYIVTSIFLAGRKTLHGNHESLVYHEPECRFWGSRNCSEVFHSSRAAIDAGYTPAKCCHT